MPLFMDIHVVDSPTFSVQDVVTAHMQDLSIEKKFGVEQIKYWVNVEERTIFCLMKGPDRQSCNQVHKESHGMTACNIIQVSDDQFNLYLGKGEKDEQDLALTEHGKVDSGYRTLLYFSCLDLKAKPGEKNQRCLELIERFGGSGLKDPGEAMIGVFVEADQAFACGKALYDLFQESQDETSERIVMVTGKPVDPEGTDLFQDAHEKLTCIDDLCTRCHLIMDRDTYLLLGKKAEFDCPEMTSWEVLEPSELSMLLKIHKVLLEHLSDANFHIDSLAAELGMSRSVLYRRIRSITGSSPNKMIQDLRLKRSVSSLKCHEMTIAEIAYLHGFNSPSYFTRSFKKRYGQLPSAC